MIAELEMGPAGAMRLLELGKPYQRPNLEIAGPVRGGNYLHNIKGYGGGGIVRKRKWIKNFGIRLYAVGVPDELDVKNGLVVEFKSYGDSRDIPYQVERAIFQCCYYCWMLGFDKFNKFRILLFNTNTNEVDIVIERFVEPFKFLKKFRKAIRLGMSELESGQRVYSRKKGKPVKEYYWLIRFFDSAPEKYPNINLVRDGLPKKNGAPAKVHYWLMKRFDEMALS